MDAENYDTVENEQVNERQRGPAEHLIAKHMYKFAQTLLKGVALRTYSFPSRLSRVVQISLSVFYRKSKHTQSKGLLRKPFFLHKRLIPSLCVKNIFPDLRLAERK